jgi:hypothetical protein
VYPQQNFSYLFFFLLENHSDNNNTMPSMDDNNKDMLDAMYANMDGPTPGSNNPNCSDQSKCETR